VLEEWTRQPEAPPRETDVETLYAAFIPRQIECLGDYAKAIAGVPETFEGLRSRVVRIGSTTGYTRPMLEFLVDRAREQGCEPDCAICPGDVPGGGRPAPWMCYLNAIRLEISPLWTMVKIGDTPSDIAEGPDAGMWTIGVTRTSNEAGLTAEEWDAATAAARDAAIAQASKRLRDAGAHNLVESAGDCLAAIDEIAGRIASSARP